MVSVSIFVSSGMKNILDEQKIIENSWDFNWFSSKIQNIFNYTGSWKYIKKMTSSTWVLFKRWQYFWEGWFTYIWETTQDKVYCLSWSENTQTNNLIVKTFVPFEEFWEDMFDVPAWSYDKIFTAKKWNYTSYALDDVVMSWSSIIIWKWIYWDKFVDWDFWTGVYLNNPTWLALSGSNILFVSDTLNDRVLYYNISTKKIYKLLDENDWLQEPTGLYYNAWKLYISNSWKWEILEYSSPVILNNQNLNIIFTWWTVNNINNFEIDFFTWVTLTWPNNTGSYVFTWLNKYIDFSTLSTDKIKYYFSDYSNIVSITWNINMWICNSWVSYYLNWNKPEKKIITCLTSSTWSTTIKNWNKFNNFSSWNNIKISWITPNFSNTWTYYVNLKLFNWSTLKYQKYYPYFTQGDWDLLTPGDNTLKVFTWWLNYPTWIWFAWSIKYKEFLKAWRIYNFKNTW